MQLRHNLIPREARLSVIDVIFSLALREDPPRVTLFITLSVTNNNSSCCGTHNANLDRRTTIKFTSKPKNCRSTFIWVKPYITGCVKKNVLYTLLLLSACRSKERNLRRNTGVKSPQNAQTVFLFRGGIYQEVPLRQVRTVKVNFN